MRADPLRLSSERSSIRSRRRLLRRFGRHLDMQATWARSYANTFNECGPWAIAILMRTGSSASTGILQQRPGAGDRTLCGAGPGLCRLRIIASGQTRSFARNQGGGEGSPASGRRSHRTADGSAPSCKRSPESGYVLIYTPRRRSKSFFETARSRDSSALPLRAAASALYDSRARLLCGSAVRELAGLHVKDVDLNEKTIEVRDTKFFKSRCLPLSASAIEVVRDYLIFRAKAGAATDPDAALFATREEATDA